MKRFTLVLAGSMAGTIFGADQSGATASLPLKQVILYSSGVGFFERSGKVDGNARVQLRFRTDDINDLLKSMVVQDHGGTVGVVSYDSRDPLSKTLQSFAIDLTANPAMRDIMNQMRGERVVVLWPQSTTGTVVGVEKRVVEEEKEKKREEDYLNLFTGGKFQSIPFNQIREITLENPRLQSELQEALATLARGHDTEKKTVALTFNGNGQRDVNISYIVEAPVWKTTYRLVLSDDGGFIQGWAVVENTSDDDWNDVQLSLVSGRPISFKMDLYQPLYATRPTVQPELYLSLRPPVYQDSLQRERLEENRPVERLAASAPMFGFDTLAAAKQANMRGLALTDQASPMKVELGLAGGTGAAAQGNITGELFQYALKMPVSIARQKSAMLPIVTEKIDGSKLSIYNQSVQSKHPLNGFRLKNSTDLHLMQGPITVFDAGSYAGDARIEDLAPGQDRLISYAVDLKTEVDPRSKSHPQTLVSVKIARGTLQTVHKLVEEKNYAIQNKDVKAKTLLVEHPVRNDWKLESPASATERTREVYRFKLDLEPGKSRELTVRETQQYRESIFVSNLNSDQIGVYLSAKEVGPKVKEVLRKVAKSRDDLSKLAADRKLREDRLAEITQEQTRIRDNMQRLSQNAELYQRYVKKFDEQETEFERLRSEVSRLKEQETAQQKDVNDYLLSIDLE